MRTALDSGYTWFLEKALYQDERCLEVYIVEGIRSQGFTKIELPGIGLNPPEGSHPPSRGMTARTLQFLQTA